MICIVKEEPFINAQQVEKAHHDVNVSVSKGLKGECLKERKETLTTHLICQRSGASVMTHNIWLLVKLAHWCLLMISLQNHNCLCALRFSQMH